MEAHKSHTATNESPKLCVVDLPVVERNDNKFFSGLLQDKTERMERGHWGQCPWRKDVSSKYKGVHYHKHYYKTGKCWHAQIYFRPKKGKVPISLGTYEDEKEAALAYDKAALELFGEYARTNQMIYPEDFKECIPTKR